MSSLCRSPPIHPVLFRTSACQQLTSSSCYHSFASTHEPMNQTCRLKAKGTRSATALKTRTMSTSAVWKEPLARNRYQYLVLEKQWACTEVGNWLRFWARNLTVLESDSYYVTIFLDTLLTSSQFDHDKKPVDKHSIIKNCSM